MVVLHCLLLHTHEISAINPQCCENFKSLIEVSINLLNTMQCTKLRVLRFTLCVFWDISSNLLVHPFFSISNWRKNRKTLYLLNFFWNPMLSNSIAYHFFETLLLSNCLIFDYFFWKMKKGLFSFKNTEKWWKLPFFKFLHQFMEKNCP